MAAGTSNPITTTYVAVLPETSRLAEILRRAFREVDDDARRAGQRWAAEIERALHGAGHVNVDADTRRARERIRDLDREIRRRRAIEIDIDRGKIASAAGTAGRLFAKALGGAAVGALGGLAITGGVGGLTALTGAIAQAGGALALLPAAVGGAAVAIGGLKVAALGFGDALKNIGDPKKFADALADLSPNAQAAALAIQSMMPQLTSLKNAVQDQFFAGFAGQVQSLGAIYLPMMQGAMERVAGAANSGLTSVAEFFKGPQTVSDMSALTGNAATAFGTLSMALQPAAKALLDMGTVGSQFLPQLAGSATRAAESFAQFIGNARESGQLQGWIQTGLDTLRDLGDVAGNVASTIGGIFKAGNDVGGGLIGSLKTITATMNEFVNSAEGQSALSTFFSSAKEALSALSPILKTVASSVLGTILPAFTQLGTAAAPALQALFTNLTQVMNTLAPVVVSLSGPISTLLNALGPAIVQTIQALAPAVEPLAGAFASLIAGVAPLLPVLGQLVGAVVGALAPALGTLFTALAPVVSSLAEALKPVLDQLAPVLAQVAMTFAQAWGQALQQITPMLPPLLQAMGGLLQAVIPLLPPLAQIGAAAIPVLAGAIQTVLPFVTALMNAFTKIAQVVIPPLVQGIQSVANIVSAVSDKVGGFLSKVGDGLSKIPGLGGIFGGEHKADGGMINGRFASGGAVRAGSGYISGPGSGTSDSILAMVEEGGAIAVSNTESINTAESTRRNWPLIDAMNKGQFDISKLPRFAGGGAVGLNPGPAYVRDLIMQMYPQIGDIGGYRAADQYGEHSSGNAIDVMIPGWNTPEGSALGDAVASFVLNNADALGLSWVLWKQRSFNPGDSTGKMMQDRGSPTQNHMDHVHIFMNKNRGALPTSPLIGGAVGSVSASGLRGSSRVSGGSGRAVQNAQDRVTDTENQVTSAQMRVDEVNAKGAKATEREKFNAEKSLTKAKREHAQALDQLAEAQAKYNGVSGSDRTGKSDNRFEDITKQMGSGLLEIFGLDGTLMKNPMEFGIVKLITGLINHKSQPAVDTGGSPAGGYAATGGDGGLGGMLSSIPQAFGNLAKGTPGQAPTEYMPAMPHAVAGNVLAGGLQSAYAAAQQPPGQTVNNIDNSISMDGQFGMNPTELKDNMTAERNARTRAPLQNLPA